MLDVKQRLERPRGTATAGEICRSGAYYAATASWYLAGGKKIAMNEHFPIMLEKWAEAPACLCLLLLLLLRASEYRCFVSLTAGRKAVFWPRASEMMVLEPPLHRLIRLLAHFGFIFQRVHQGEGQEGKFSFLVQAEKPASSHPGTFYREAGPPGQQGVLWRSRTPESRRHVSVYSLAAHFVLTFLLLAVSPSFHPLHLVIPAPRFQSALPLILFQTEPARLR